MSDSYTEIKLRKADFLRIIKTAIGFYLLVFVFATPFYPFLFPWGGAQETYLHPIYFGLIALSVLIVICTILILEEIQSLKQELMKTSESNEQGE